ncbi:MAG: hypothetical protein RI842_04725 [Schleiferiaceae bacterium]|jgi:hypothetical protein|nr:hypothetical protein [Schleiferiaceae bacterium]MDR9442000.1 hypothetical protein [Schleiferiaceae bacterium]
MDKNDPITVDISQYPLESEYLERIDDFLYRLHARPGIKVVTQRLSTQLYGPGPLVFAALQEEILRSFEGGQCPFVLKILRGDLSDYPLKDYH